MKRNVKINGKWVEAEECIHKFVSEPYYMVAGHVFSKYDVEEIGKRITEKE